MNKIDLTKEQQQELQKIADEVQKEAELVIKDYTETPSTMDGTITTVHENSPLLDAD
jgi:3-deoxy-D-arabino-heptulosonate 7-phosphate (DAHP) synthase